MTLKYSFAAFANIGFVFGSFLCVITQRCCYEPEVAKYEIYRLWKSDLMRKVSEKTKLQSGVNYCMAGL